MEHMEERSMKNPPSTGEKWRAMIPTLGIFALSSGLIAFGVYQGIPFLMSKGMHFATAYLLGFYPPFALLFFGALLIFRYQHGPWDWKRFQQELRLHRPDKKTWLTVGLAFPILMLGFSLASALGAILSGNLTWLHAPDDFPAGLNPHRPLIFGEFMGLPLSGRWDYALYYALGWFFNIFGEELMFRGILLPRHEEIWGKNAWLIHGLIWGFWHVFWYWQFFPLTLFVTLPLLYVVHRTKNTWSIIVLHGLFNAIPLFFIIAGVVA